MRVADFDFDLPPELIAQEPPGERGGSRLLVIDRARETVAHRQFHDLPELLQAGDLLVVNDTKVFPARLLGRRLPGGGAAECLLVRRLDVDVWECLVHPGQRLRAGARMVFERAGHTLHADVLDSPVAAAPEREPQMWRGRRRVRFTVQAAAQSAQGPPDQPPPRLRRSATALATADGGPHVPSLDAVVDAIGHIPLPPYIKRDDRPDDRDRYQTVYAHERGSIAAPTAGLHFTPAVLEALASRGVDRVAVTLHVGYGTFQPVRVDEVEEHRVDAEHYEIGAAAAAAIARARRDGRRVIAVGTTTVRTLETAGRGVDAVAAGAGETDLFIHPGHEFRVVDGLITNFHLPRSSLLMLVAAFAGRDRLLDAYRTAVAERYRFYSYGDATLII